MKGSSSIGSRSGISEGRRKRWCGRWCRRRESRGQLCQHSLHRQHHRPHPSDIVLEFLGGVGEALNDRVRLEVPIVGVHRRRRSSGHRRKTVDAVDEEE